MMITNTNEIKKAARVFVTEKMTQVGGAQFLDEVYRLVWKNQVICDVKQYAEDHEIFPDNWEKVEKLAETVAEAYVFEGEYDCNLSYWQNLKNLICENMPEGEFE